LPERIRDRFLSIATFFRSKQLEIPQFDEQAVKRSKMWPQVVSRVRVGEQIWVLLLPPFDPAE